MTTGRMIELVVALLFLIAGIWLYRARKTADQRLWQPRRRPPARRRGDHGDSCPRRSRLSPEPVRARHAEGSGAVTGFIILGAALLADRRLVCWSMGIRGHKARHPRHTAMLIGGHDADRLRLRPRRLRHRRIKPRPRSPSTPRCRRHDARCTHSFSRSLADAPSRSPQAVQAVRIPLGVRILEAPAADPLDAGGSAAGRGLPRLGAEARPTTSATCSPRSSASSPRPTSRCRIATTTNTAACSSRPRSR